ncbi:MAG TPA: GNAT family N-acetyltransferase [Blastocatellia bacterium]|nr:GNAT family N-acetyltransferase [Blastocatellia bacterium]
MSLHIIPAEASDIELLLVFMRDFYLHEALLFDEEVARRALQQLIGNAAFGRIFLLEFAGENVGYTVLTFGFSLEFHGRDAFVDELYVVAEHRGRGIGKQALEFLVEVCRTESIAALHLEVERANTIAQEVYRKQGFKDHDRYLLTKWI